MHRRTSLENTQSIRKCLSSVNILMRVNLAKAWKADGMAAIAAFLNNSGYKKKLRKNNTIEGFSTSFVKGVLDNPIYCGKLAFGRRKNEKIPGTRNEYHIVKQKDYLLSDGIHEAIISEEMWNQAHRKRQETGVLQVKTHSLEYEHILSGIIKCPVCGSGMYGNVNRKKHPDGGYYKDYFYYACKHRNLVDGHRCTYKRQWNEDRINVAVEEIIRKFVKNPKFEQEIRKQIGSSIDTTELDRDMVEKLKKPRKHPMSEKVEVNVNRITEITKRDILDLFRNGLEIEEFLRFLCEVFHPAVRYEKRYWKEFLTEINKLLQNDETGISERTILHLSAIQVQIHGRTCSFRAECLRP